MWGELWDHSKLSSDFQLATLTDLFETESENFIDFKGMG